MNWVDFARQAMTVPFTDKGRSFEGWDCWGLVCCAYWEVLGLRLPTYAEGYENTADARRLAHVVQAATGGADWQETARAAGAIAVIQRRRRPVHVGLVVSGSDILHCEAGAGTIRNRDGELHIQGFWIPA